MKRTIIISSLALLLVVGIASAMTLTGTSQEIKEFAGEIMDNPPEEMLLGGATAPYEYVYTIPTGDAAQLLKTSFGILGSVIITGAGAGDLTLYNATTTNANLRATAATSSLPVIASFPANTAVGNYDFDVAFNDGLLAVFTGVIGTSTITFN